MPTNKLLILLCFIVVREKYQEYHGADAQLSFIKRRLSEQIKLQPLGDAAHVNRGEMFSG